MIDAEDEPRQWVQWHVDGRWSPVFADGWTGDPVSVGEMLAARAAASEPTPPSGALASPLMDVEPLSVNNNQDEQ